LRKLKKDKIASLPVWLEDQVWQQQIFGGSRALINNNGQRNSLNFTAAVFTSRPEKDDCLQVRHVRRWRGCSALCCIPALTGDNKCAASDGYWVLISRAETVGSCDRGVISTINIHTVQLTEVYCVGFY
jgi:hypothetical protein